MKHKIKKVVVFGLNNVGEKILKYIKKDKSLKVYLFKKKKFTLWKNKKYKSRYSSFIRI